MKSLNFRSLLPIGLPLLVIFVTTCLRGSDGLSQVIAFSEIPDQISAGGPIVLSASASSGLPVVYSITSAGSVATLSGNILSLSGATGSVTVQASQSGDDTHAAAPRVNRTFIVSDAALRFVTFSKGSAANHSLGIRGNGTLWGWGYNSDYQLGLGVETRMSQAAPRAIDDAATWREVAGGHSHTVAVRTDGTIWSWGNGDNGRLGYDASSGTQYTPMRIGSESTWVSVACGFAHSVALRSNGTLWSWGLNSSGALGSGNTNDRTIPALIGGSSNWAKVACGRAHTAAINNNGELWVWGENSSGQLGTGNTTNRLIPVKVGNSTDWSQVACGSSFTVALKSNGTLWAWGASLANGTATQQTNPVQIGTSTDWTSISCGDYHTAALRSDGTLWTWGSNGHKQLGDGGSTSSAMPNQVGDATDWVQVVCGEHHTIAMRSGGEVFTWGKNDQFQLGSGESQNPTQPRPLPGSTWKSSAFGVSHAAGVKSDGTLWAWGLNDYGQLGDGTLTTRGVPTQVGGDSNWASVACGLRHTLALRDDGTLWAFGSNNEGQLGTGTPGYSYQNGPVQVGVETSWKVIACGGYHSVAIREDGTLWAWGYNVSGQLGNGQTSDRNSPVQIGTATNWASVSCGERHTVAIRTDGTLWAWGFNGSGRLGTGGSNEALVPTRVGSAVNWDSVSCGRSHTAAVRKDGTLWAWGVAGYSISTTPKQIGNETTWSSVSGGDGIIMALRRDGTAWAWGSLGDPFAVTSPQQIGNGTGWKSIPKTLGNDYAAFAPDGSLWVWAVQPNGSRALGFEDPSSHRQIWPLSNEQSISWSIPSTLAIGRKLTLPSISESGMPLTYSVSGPATLDLGCLIATATGLVTVTAYQAGDRSWLPMEPVGHAITAIAVPEIHLTGNGVQIESGDNSPDSSDNTFFGELSSNDGSVELSFTIINSGSRGLNLTGAPLVSLSGSSAFSVANQPSSPVVSASGGTTSFTVGFSPETAGLHSAIVRIENDDDEKNPFTYKIAGNREVSPVECIFTNGAKSFSETILPGGRFIFEFQVETPSAAVFHTWGGASLRAVLRTAAGETIANSDSDNDFEFREVLLAGFYELEIFREDLPGALQNFNVALDISKSALARPDLAVGATPLQMQGSGRFAPELQYLEMISRRARPVNIYAKISNTNKLSGEFLLTGGRGNAFFDIAWSGPSGNVTASILTGSYRTSTLAEGAHELISARITPVKQRIVKKRGKRSTIKKKSLVVGLHASTSEGPSQSDSVTIQVKTE
jgi:alpha-tubulin suppressor-like RCC1 family protein